MAKIYKMNNGGTLGVSINNSMKAAGYLAGSEIEWTAETGGFMLRIKKPQDIPPVEKDEVKEVLEPL
jgi:hypothetical protein